MHNYIPLRALGHIHGCVNSMSDKWRGLKNPETRQSFIEYVRGINPPVSQINPVDMAIFWCQFETKRALKKI